MVVVQVRIHGEERQQFGMTGDFELNIEILRGFCLVRGQAINFDCRLLCFQLALGHTLEHRAGLEDRSVYARVESDIICFGYRLLGGFGSRLLVCYACCGGFLICFGCGPLLIVRYVSCRLVGFRLGGCRLSGLRLGVFRLSGFGFPGGSQAGQLQHAVRQCPPAENRRHSWYSERTERFRLTCLRQPLHRIQQPPPTPLPARLCWERA